MGSFEITEEVFDLENPYKERIVLFETKDDDFHAFDLTIENSESFRMTKPRAKKLIRYLGKAFDIEVGFL